MIKLQNNFTTPKQSKHLLELELPVDSADCFFEELFGDGINYPFIIQPYLNKSEIFKQHLPCWSVSRLMEIYCICRECTWEYITNNPPIEDILCDIELRIDELNFSKLN